eukprot:TRINITY_DN104293_c0_g1_i1.p1 TRINITY_DN104293_c0_g1~~TRINITY_DN104293_c0_g1_i1.p1  ORF type:complete len:112 (-),score=19.33 TRINITY_DN104293_c0_g1_i1:76-411(-)
MASTTSSKAVSRRSHHRFAALLVLLVLLMLPSSARSPLFIGARCHPPATRLSRLAVEAPEKQTETEKDTYIEDVTTNFDEDNFQRINIDPVTLTLIVFAVLAFQFFYLANL